jgi:hypothetical protein
MVELGSADREAGGKTKVMRLQAQGSEPSL